MSFAMQGVLLWGQIAGADLTGKLFCFVKVDTSGNLILATAAGAAIGTLVEEGTLGGQATVQLNGIAKVRANATMAAGTRVETDGNGFAVTLSGGVALGVLLEAAVPNQIVAIKLY